MSKNVAVFVDVANIFYAAKAAGVDIDYVTLLKSATAGRDFVRAYAYTGLDPENENQRQFHAFLARSGYKVVSKDIRKYGDGRIKANLDIELVVDLMRMAEKLDIAVVISGDGDFAPAIYAVQQQGVRVEVISFRGNTSSDLIDAADVFIDIATVARVEKGARSGRRVAAEGDLSMTEVPDKESGVVPRRRRQPEERGDRPERASRRRGTPTAATSATSATSEPEARGRGAGLVALPGERLSRGGIAVPTVEQPSALAEEPAEPEAIADESAALDEGRRRRRRRGGRGRGRGGRPGEAEAAERRPRPRRHRPGRGGGTRARRRARVRGRGADAAAALRLRVGVGQPGIGMPSGRPVAPTPAVSQGHAADDEIEGEPEVPEYLLAERRQQGRGGRGGRGRSGGYRTAIDRERYGTGARSGFSRNQPRGSPGAVDRRRARALRCTRWSPSSRRPAATRGARFHQRCRSCCGPSSRGAREEQGCRRPARRPTPVPEVSAAVAAEPTVEATAESGLESPAEAPRGRRTRKRQPLTLSLPSPRSR